MHHIASSDASSDKAPASSDKAPGQFSGNDRIKIADHHRGPDSMHSDNDEDDIPFLSDSDDGAEEHHPDPSRPKRSKCHHVFEPLGRPIGSKPAISIPATEIIDLADPPEFQFHKPRNARK